MKKFFLPTVILILCSFLVNAQGVYQIWGTTQYGGPDDLGVIFSASGNGDNVRDRFNFFNKYPGSRPVNELVEYKGKFYGVTNEAGKKKHGSIYEWDPSTNVFTNKINFNTEIGRNPQSSLTLSGDKFYGMTANGGAFDAGVIFEWDPETNIYTKKIDFDFATGYLPTGDLTLCNGKYYGTTLFGGAYDAGVIFEWDPIGNIFTKKIDFNKTNGWQGIGSLLQKDGKLYGTTYQGGKYGFGVIFEYDPSNNNYAVKKEFTGTDGGYSYFGARLSWQGDKFFGMTAAGGTNNEGVIFQWDPATNVYSKKVDLNSLTGRTPIGSLVFKDDKFYGMTNLGGKNDQGVIFEWDPVSNQYIKRIDFADVGGKEPFGSLALKGNTFYGTTWKGGLFDHGTIFAWDPVTNVFTKKVDFDYSDGSFPQAGITYERGKFYGTTGAGGVTNNGVIYEFDPATNTYVKRIDFLEATGYDVVGNLVSKDGKLYGTTRGGGSKKFGVIFEWDPLTNVYTKKIDFTTVRGAKPMGGLTLYKDKFYGTTSQGGNNFGGVIFQWDPVKNLYEKKIELYTDKYTTSPGGNNFVGPLVLKAGKFYGTTSGGGINNTGTIFEWDPASNIYIKKIDFNAGTAIAGGLVNYNDKFYGTSSIGGSSNGGFIYEWDPVTNVINSKIYFDTAKGLTPDGGLQVSAGKLYGMTTQGGSYSKGTLFQWDPLSNIYIKKTDFNGANGASPFYNSLTLAPAPVAGGLPGRCVNFPDIIIDSTNNNSWVAITDTLGDAVAEIKANGNNLGIVSSSMFINTAAIREDVAKKGYLDRNITIEPQVQPASAVDVRLYIKGAEYRTLKNSLNSAGLPPGIDSINDIRIYKNNAGCSGDITGNLTAVPTTAANWDSNYVLSASISSLSSFYFAAKPLGSKVPPAVTLTLPANNSTYLSGGNVNLKAVASDADGKVVKVSFYQGTTLLYTATDTPYTFKWEQVYKGHYTLTARAMDDSGLVTISDPVQISVVPNTPPAVNIFNPSDNQAFLAGSTIHLQAGASDPDGRITTVQFFNGSTLLATEHKLPYTFDWKPGTAGKYVLTAKATDNWGAVTLSAPITISLVPNQPPAVAIIKPTGAQTFIAPAMINLEADAHDPDGRIVQVSFYNGTTLLTNSEHKAPYTYQWQNVPAGTYTITAAAKDNWSAETTSKPITVTVLPANQSFVNNIAPSAGVHTGVLNSCAIQLAPNPAIGILNIHVTGVQKNERSIVSIISASGAVVQTKQVNRFSPVFKLDVSSLAGGVYVIKFESGGKVMYKQFVKM